MQDFTIIRKLVTTEKLEVLADSKEEAEATIKNMADGFEWEILETKATYQVTEV